MIRSFIFAVALQATLGTAAFACDGQTGASIFQDTFADDSGGWDMGTNVKIVPPVMEMKVSKESQGTSTQNLTFNADNADYCEQFVFPTPVANNPLGVGIEFWATDYNNLYMFFVQDDQKAFFYKKAAGNWNTIFSAIPVEGLNTAPNAVHTILVHAKAGVLTLMVDGKKVKVIRAQMPTGALRFGVFAQSVNVPETPIVFQISNYSVTAGQ